MSHPNARLTLHGRRLLIERVRSGRPVAHVAGERGISRATAYKWVRRWRTEGDAGPFDRPSVVEVVPESAVRVVVGDQPDRDEDRGDADWVPLAVEAGQQGEEGGVGLLGEPAEEVGGPGTDLRVLVVEQFKQDGKLGADRVIGAQCALAGVGGVPRRTVRPSLAQVLQPLLVGLGGDLLVVPAQILFRADGCGAPRGDVDAEREVVLVMPINGQTGQQQRVDPGADWARDSDSGEERHGVRRGRVPGALVEDVAEQAAEGALPGLLVQPAHRPEVAGHVLGAAVGVPSAAQSMSSSPASRSSDRFMIRMLAGTADTDPAGELSPRAQQSNTPVNRS